MKTATLSSIRGIAILLMLTPLFNSCGDDDDTNPSPTPSELFEIITRDATDIEYYTATLNGHIKVNGTRPSNITIGFLYNETPELNPDKAKTISSEAVSDYVFRGYLTNLSLATTYYYRAYALYNGKYYYGDVKTLTTKPQPEKKFSLYQQWKVEGPEDIIKEEVIGRGLIGLVYDMTIPNLRKVLVQTKDGVWRISRLNSYDLEITESKPDTLKGKISYKIYEFETTFNVWETFALTQDTLIMGTTISTPTFGIVGRGNWP